jgi:hypothetical protein
MCSCVSGCEYRPSRAVETAAWGKATRAVNTVLELTCCGYSSVAGLGVQSRADGGLVLVCLALLVVACLGVLWLSVRLELDCGCERWICGFCASQIGPFRRLAGAMVDVDQWWSMWIDGDGGVGCGACWISRSMLLCGGMTVG